VNIDRFLKLNQPLWDRLDALTRKAGTNPKRLTTSELEELVATYERVNTHLSLARTQLRDPGLVAALTGLTARAGAVVYGHSARSWRTLARFFTDTFPAAIWYARTFVVIATLLFALPAVAFALWLGNSEVALSVAAPEVVRQAYVEEDFEAYYSSSPSTQFASEVTTNNIQVGVMAFASGILLCIPTAFVLAYNGMNLGGAWGMFIAAGQQPKFWGLIVPHGLLELTAVFIAGAAGLRLGWTLIDPGDRPRGEALTEEGRRAIAIVLGLVVVFLLAGLVEGFVTGSSLPTWARVGVGVVLEIAFVVYVVVRGRAAAAQGLTGAIGEDRDAGWARRT
jgi:uncharacterized membrane protein SpoIIM required for sporulation